MDNIGDNMARFSELLNQLMYVSWVVVGLTQVVKDELKRNNIDNPGLIRLCAMTFGALTGLFFTGGQWIGLGAGLVMGLVTTGVVSTTFQVLEKNSSAVIIEDAPMIDNVENIENIESNKQ